MKISLQSLREVPALYYFTIGLCVIVPLAVCIILMIGYLVLTLGYLEQTGALYDRTNNIFGGDFVNLWAAAQLVGQGNAASIFDPDAFFAAQKEYFGDSFRRHYWSYPPHTLFFAAVLSPFSYLAAFVVWFGLTFTLFGASLRAAGYHWGLLLIVVLAPSSFINMFTGQNGLLTVAFIVAGWTLKKNHPWWAGVMFGLLTFKPQLGFLIPVALIAAREWRPIISAGLTTVALIAASTLVFGFDVWPLYIEQILPDQAEFMSNDKIGGARWMSPTVYIAARTLGQDFVSAYWIQVPFTVLAATVIYQACRRSWPTELQLALLLTAPFLASSWALNYDMTFLSVAAAILMTRALPSDPTPAEVITAGFVWILPLIIYPMNAFGFPLSPIILMAFSLCIWKRAEGASDRDLAASVPGAPPR